MSALRVANDLFVRPTPTGAYWAVSAPEPTPRRDLLASLLRSPVAPPLTVDNVRAWTGLIDEEEALDVLLKAQGAGLVEGHHEQTSALTGSLEEILPVLLSPLSEDGRVLLVDEQGFDLATVGFDEQVADELAALAADLASLHSRHRDTVRGGADLDSSAWALVDSFGNSQVGFWPIYLGDERFILIVGGLPHLNDPALAKLIWTLSIRYGDGAS